MTLPEKDPRIIPTAFAEELITPQGLDLDKQYGGYGLGWMVIEIENKTKIYHAGLNGGFTAQAGFIPSDRRGGLVLTNSSGSLQADVPGIVLRKGLGLDPGATLPTVAQHMTIWGMLAMTIILFFSFIFSTVRFTAYAKNVERVNVFRRVLPSSALFVLAYGLAVIIPKTQGIDLSGIKGFNPDIWLCLTLSAAIATLWGLTRFIYPR